MSQLVLFVIVIVVIFAIVKWAKKMEQERSLNLQEVATKMGFEFQQKTPAEHLERYKHFHLFTQGHSRRTKNLITNTDQSVEGEIFGYQYTTSNGKNSSTHNHTVVSLTNSQHHFPDIELRPEHIFHKIGSIFGYQDIDFNSHTEFSKKYLLRGRKEPAIRKLFNSDVLSYFESSEPVCLEARGNTVILYQQYKRVEPEELINFYQSAQATYQVLCDSLIR